MPLEAAEMALLRVIHASELPDPGALLEKLASGEAVAAARAAAAPTAESQGALLQAPASFRRLWSSCSAQAARPHLAQQLHDFVGLVRYAPPELVLQAAASRLPGDFIRELARGAEGADRHSMAGRASPTARPQPTLLEQEKARGRAAAPGGARRAAGQGRVRGLSRSRAGRLQRSTNNGAHECRISTTS